MGPIEVRSYYKSLDPGAPDLIGLGHRDPCHKSQYKFMLWDSGYGGLLNLYLMLSNCLLKAE